MSMNLRSWCLALSASAVLLGAAAVPAAASGPTRSVDARSVHAAWSAERDLARGLLHSMPAATEAVGAYLSATAQSCPAVLTGLGSQPAAIKQPAVRDVVREAWLDLDATTEAPARPAVARYQRRLTGLRWSHRAIGAAARRDAEALGAEVALPPSDLCADARQLVAESGQVEPAGTRAWLDRFDQLNAEADRTGTAFTKRLGRLSGLADLPQMLAVVQLGRRYDARERQLLQTGLGKLVAVLGLAATVHVRSDALEGRLGS